MSMNTKKHVVISFAGLLIPILLFSIWCGGIFAFTVYIAGFITCSAAALLLRQSSGVDCSGKIQVPAVAVCWACAILLLALSALPLPGKLDKLTGSRRYSQNNIVRTHVTAAAQTGCIKKYPLNFSITRNRAGTLRILLLAIAMLGTATLSASMPVSMKKRYLTVLIVFFTVVAAVGFVHQWILPKEKTIWWIFKAEHGQPVASFINRTHYAGFIAMGCSMALVFFLHALANGKWLKALFFGLAVLVTGFAVSASLARGALLAGFVSVVIITVTSLFRGRILVSLPVFLTACLLVTSIATGIMIMPKNKFKNTVLPRIESLRHPIQTDSAQSRLGAWRAAVRIWRDYPVIGVGLNGFRMLFPQYRLESDRKSFSHTENEYVELLVDSGLTGMALMLLLFAAFVYRWRINAKNNILPDDISLAVLGATIVAMIHNAVDFPMHEPLYAVVFASIMGLVLNFHENENAQPAHCVDMFNIPAKMPRYFLITCAFFCLFSLVVSGTTPSKLDYAEFIERAGEKDMVSALSSSPTAWYVWTRFGSYVFQKDTFDSMRIGEQCFSRAADYDPNNYLLWESVGRTRLLMGDEESANAAYSRMKELRVWKEPKKTRKDKY